MQTLIAATKRAPWAKAQILDEFVTGDAMIEAAGLDWNVGSRNVFIDGSAYADDCEVVPGYKALIREDTGKPLSIVGEKYGIVQNREALTLLDSAIGNGAHYIAAGALSGGKRVFALAELDEGADVAGDEHKAYMLLSTGHDGATSVSLRFLVMRLFCWNQLNFMLNNGTSIAIRHATNAKDRVDQAGEAIERIRDYFGVWSQRAHALANQTLSIQRALDVTERVFPEYKNAAGDTVVPTAQGKVYDLFRRQHRTDPQIAGTKYGYFNAVTAYLDHNRGGDRMARIVKGESERVRTQVIEHLEAA